MVVFVSGEGTCGFKCHGLGSRVDERRRGLTLKIQMITRLLTVFESV